MEVLSALFDRTQLSARHVFRYISSHRLAVCRLYMCICITTVVLVHYTVFPGIRSFSFMLSNALSRLLDIPYLPDWNLAETCSVNNHYLDESAIGKPCLGLEPNFATPILAEPRLQENHMPNLSWHIRNLIKIVGTPCPHVNTEGLEVWG